MVDVPTRAGDDRALLVFASEEAAEDWRRNTGAFPASEGFIAQTADPDGLRAILDAWEFKRVALWGIPGLPDTLGELDGGEFIGLLELGEMAVEHGLLDDE